MSVLLASYYYKPHIGGVENSLFHLAQSFTQKGQHVFILASDADLTKKKRLPAYEIIDGIEVFRFHRFIPLWTLFSLFSPLVDIWRAAHVIRKICVKRKVLFILSRNHILGLAAKRAGVQHLYYHVSSIVKSLDAVSAKRQSGFKQKILAAYINTLLNPLQQSLQNQCFRKATQVIVFSHNLKRQVLKIAPLTKNKIQVIFPGVNSAESVKEYTVVEKKANFLILGRFIYAKRIDLAIEAMALLPDFATLHIVGDGPLKLELQRKVRTKGLSERVLFFDATSLVAEHYTQADCFLMTSMYETFGQTIIEAMSFGLPVIAFKSNDKDVITSSNEILDELENGYLCNFSISALAHAMLNMLQLTPQERAVMGNNNIKKTKEMYTWSKFTEQVLALEKKIW